MILKKIRKDKKGVSPVIGVILMVAATIVIAAVVIAMLGGFGAPERAPLATFRVVDCSVGGSGIVLEHTGGDGITFADITGTVDADGDSGSGAAVTAAWGINLDVNGDTIINPGDRIASAVAPTAGLPYSYTVYHIPTGQLITANEVTATA